METLKEKILKDGYIIEPNILKVDQFINHQIDVELFIEIGQAFKSHFANQPITKILTVEASGIAVASLTSLAFGNIPVVFAKKATSAITAGKMYQASVHSFTKNQDYQMIVDQRFITKDDCVLIVDDFLANGQASLGLVSIVEQAGATLAGVGIVIEKGFQTGRELLEEKGIDVHSLAIIESFEEGRIVFK